jgi:hypothetical protein
MYELSIFRGFWKHLRTQLSRLPAIATGHTRFFLSRILSFFLSKADEVEELRTLFLFRTHDILVC